MFSLIPQTKIANPIIIYLVFIDIVLIAYSAK